MPVSSPARRRARRDRDARRDSRRSSRATPYRVEPGDQEQEADVEDVLAGESVTVDLGVEEVAEEVVAALVAPFVEQPLEVRVDRVRGLLLVRLGLGVAELVPDDVVGTDHPVLHPQEPRSSSSGRPNSVRNTCDGKGTENCLGKSISSSSTNPSMRSFDEPGDRFLERLHGCGANNGSSSFRYVRWSGGSIWRGISGRPTSGRAPPCSTRTPRGSAAPRPPRPRGDDDPTPSTRRTGVLLQHRVGRLRVPRQLWVHELRQPHAVALVTLHHGAHANADRMFGLGCRRQSGWTSP